MKTILAREIDGETRKKSTNRHRIKKSAFRHKFFLESYGVKISVTSNTAEAIEETKRIVAENILLDIIFDGK